MRKCIAYVRSRQSPHVWRACPRSAVPKFRFCRIHGDAVMGAFLVLLVKDFRERNARKASVAEDDEPHK
jgi:hypothetical protein